MSEIVSWSEDARDAILARMSYIMVDVESDGPIPGDYSMVCFGAVVVEPGLPRTFYGRLKPISESWDEGALKVSDHHVRSPLLSINMSCQTCHKATEEELKFRVETIQTRTFNLRSLAMDALVQLINDIKAARDAGTSDAMLAAARDNQRKAQFYLDFVEAENSMGFHAPEEAARILAESINFTRLGQVALRDARIISPGGPVAKAD